MNTGNSTWPQERETETTGKIVLKAISLVIYIVVGTYGNGRTIYTIWSDQRMQMALNTFISVVSLCDLAMCVFIMPFALISLVNGQWMFGNVLCKIHHVSAVYLAQVTVLCIATVVFERYLSICRRRYPSLSRNKTLCLISAFFILPIPFSFPYYRQDLVYSPSTGMCFNAHRTHQAETTYVLTADAIILKVLPFSVDLFSFWKIFIVLRRLRRRVGPGPLSNEDKLIANAHAHSAGTSLAFVLIYFALDIPLYTALVVHWRLAVNGQSGISGDVRAASLWLFWLACIIKPIIYALRNRRGAGHLRRPFPEARQNRIQKRMQARRNPHRIYHCEELSTNVTPTDDCIQLERIPPSVPKLAFGDFTDLASIEVEAEPGSAKSKIPNRCSSRCSRSEGNPRNQGVAMTIERFNTQTGEHRLTAALAAIMRSLTKRRADTNVGTISNFDNVLEVIDLDKDGGGRSIPSIGL